jgi:hypothetical protein
MNRIQKLNDNIKSYSDTWDKIRRLIKEMNELNDRLSIYKENIEYYKNMTDEEYKKKW